MSRRIVFKDPRGHHVRLYKSIYESHAWYALTHTERSLYIALRTQLNGSNNGNISATLVTLKKDGFTSSSTLSKSLRALMVAGLIDKTRQGGIAGFGGPRHCNLFRFTDEETFNIPGRGVVAMKATTDWRKWTSQAQVSAAIEKAHVESRRPVGPVDKGAQNDRELRHSNGIASKAEAVGKKIASVAEHRNVVQLRPPNAGKRR